MGCFSLEQVMPTKAGCAPLSFSPGWHRHHHFFYPWNQTGVSFGVLDLVVGRSPLFCNAWTARVFTIQSSNGGQVPPPFSSTHSSLQPKRADALFTTEWDTLESTRNGAKLETRMEYFGSCVFGQRLFFFHPSTLFLFLCFCSELLRYR